MQLSEEKIYRELALDLSKNFALDTNKAVFDVDNFFEQFQKNLSEHIFDLLQNDYNRLLAILYRIDVNEKVVQNALKGKDIFTAADDLATAIIERLIQKIRFRMGG
jgi:hypothetical protein